jgi:hypothetical protein
MSHFMLGKCSNYFDGIALFWFVELDCLLEHEDRLDIRFIERNSLHYSHRVGGTHEISEDY